MTSERDAWIALASAQGVGDVTFTRLLERWSTASDALAAVARMPAGRADSTLARELGQRVHRGLAAAIAAAASDPLEPQRQMEALGGWSLSPLDKSYPPRLHDADPPPLALFGLGDPELLAEPHLVAVVGTRRPTPVARDLATRIARRLTEAAAVVASGLAIGVDGVAHRAALDAGGHTVAVVGSGLDRPAPAANASLARAIAATGVIVGELAPGVRATSGTFPRRNRIISALASAVIVVEAPARSGALITARHALEQGRPLLVAPGRPLDRRVAGNLALLRETPAEPLVGLDEMLADLHLDRRDSRTTPTPTVVDAEVALSMLGEQERAVGQVLARGPCTVDDLCHATRLTAGIVSATLTLLQLRGWARSIGATQLPSGPLLDLPHGS